MKAIKIGSISQKQINEIKKLEQRTFGAQALKLNELEKLANSHLSLIARKEEVLCGYLLAKVEKVNNVQLLMINIDPYFQNSKIAQALYDDFIDRAKEQGIAKVITHIDATNFLLYQVLIKRGFQESGPVEDYFGPGQTALCLTRLLN